MIRGNADAERDRIECWQGYEHVSTLSVVPDRAPDNLATGFVENNPLSLSISQTIDRYQLKREVERIEQQLRASEARFQNLIAKNPDAMAILDRYGLVKFANTAAAALFQCSSQALVDRQFFGQLAAADGRRGRSLDEVPPTSVVEIIRAGGEGAIAQLHLMETEWQGELAYLATLRELSELLQMRAGVESSSSAIAIWDAMGKAQYHNPAFVNLFGYTVAEINAVGGPQVIYANPTEADAALSRLQATHSWQGQLTTRTRKGTLMPTFVRADAIKDSSGKTIGMVGIYTLQAPESKREAACNDDEEGDAKG